MAIQIIVGVVTGLISSGFFFFLLCCLRPRIAVSPYIAVFPDPRGQPRSAVKFVNRSGRDLLNIRVILRHVRVEQTGTDPLYHRTPLVEMTVEHLPGNRRRERHLSQFSQWISLDGDIRQSAPVGSGCYLQLLLVATDSVTGFSRAFTHEYRNPKHVVDSRHRTGNHLTVEPLPDAISATAADGDGTKRVQVGRETDIYREDQGDAASGALVPAARGAPRLGPGYEQEIPDEAKQPIA
jgi:hypothetical protein